MDYKLLGKSVATVLGAAVFGALVVNALIWLFTTVSTNGLICLLALCLLALMVSIDYKRRKFLESCKK